jgi:hypothetical protein
MRSKQGSAGQCLVRTLTDLTTGWRQVRIKVMFFRFFPNTPKLQKDRGMSGWCGVDSARRIYITFSNPQPG